MHFWHDLQTYDEGLSTQEQARVRVEKSGSLEIHGFEFHPVITLGRRASVEDDLQDSVKVLEEKFSVRHVERGGEATLHNPGQLVIYPIVNLRSIDLSVRDFVHSLQLTSVDLLKSYGVNAGLIEGCPGVYTSRGKIGFVGVRIQRGVSTHGISLNVRNDLSDFGYIRSCGILSPKLDRLQEWNTDASNKELFLRWSDLFLKRLMLDRKPSARLTHEPFQTTRS